ncbi:MAG: hypothetical protein Q9220_005333 [cf. Caloplaca sp. 1 TL-2023]
MFPATTATTSTPSPTPNNPNPTSSSATSPTTSSSPRSSRRRGLSYLKSYTHHRLSSLAGSSNDSSPATPPSQSESFPPFPTTQLPSATISEEQEPTQPTSPTDYSDEALLPPNPLFATLSPVQSHQPIPGDGAGTSVVNTAIGGITRIMARHRTESRPESLQRSVSETTTSTMPATAAPAPATNGHSHELPSIRLVPHQDPRANRPSLTFPPLARTLPSADSLIRVGRYSERDAVPNPPPNVPSAAPVGFKSKVVSRKHCEFWCKDGQWFIRDVKSSSGTFLNHIRLSQPGVESRPFPVNDGDVVQLGIDFRGGEEMIFRCVKIRIASVATHKRLLGKSAAKKDTDTSSSHSSECAICLMSIAPCQALFVAPCSHVWHFKCIRPMLIDQKQWHLFTCPNCRAMADLEADVDDPDAMNDWDEGAASDGSGGDDVRDPKLRGPSVIAAQREIEKEDESLAGLTARQLSVRNGGDPAPDTIQYAGVDPPPPSRSAHAPNMEIGQKANETPTLFNRRNGRFVSPPHHQRLSSTAEEQLGNYPLPQDGYLRPITPTQPLLGDMTGREPSTGDILTPGSEIGPMTPTNTAGPFVFDGSAGRDSVHRPVPNLSEGSAEVTTEA